MDLSQLMQKRKAAKLAAFVFWTMYKKLFLNN